jgi:hypothetical protein
VFCQTIATKFVLAVIDAKTFFRISKAGLSFFIQALLEEILIADRTTLILGLSMVLFLPHRFHLLCQFKPLMHHFGFLWYTRIGFA